MKQVVIFMPAGHKLPVSQNPTSDRNLSRFFLVSISAALQKQDFWNLERRTRVSRAMQKILSFEEQLLSIYGVESYIAYPDRISVSVNKRNAEAVTEQVTALVSRTFK